MKKLRIGVYTKTLLGQEADTEVLETMIKTSKLCRELGHEVIPATIPNLDGVAISAAFFTLTGSAMDQMAKGE